MNWLFSLEEVLLLIKDYKLTAFPFTIHELIDWGHVDFGLY